MQMIIFMDLLIGNKDINQKQKKRLQYFTQQNDQ